MSGNIVGQHVTTVPRVRANRTKPELPIAEKLGIPKGDRGNLTRYQKDALQDLESYINSGQYRTNPIYNSETKQFE